MVNIFSEKEKAFYGVEKFWAAGQEMDLSKVIVPNTPGVEWGGEDEGAAQEDADDDWGFGDEDDWELSEDEWSFAAEAATGDAPATSGVGDDWGDEDDDLDFGRGESLDAELAAAEEAANLARDNELFARLGELAEGPAADASDAPSLEELPAAYEEEAAEAEAEEEDWALGNDSLRALVDRIDSSLGDADDGSGELVDDAALGVGGDGREAVVGAKGGGSDWRNMMAEDGWEMDEEGEMTGELVDLTEQDEDE